MKSKYQRLEEFLSEADIVEFVGSEVDTQDPSIPKAEPDPFQLVSIINNIFFVEKVTRGGAAHIKFRHQETWKQIIFVGWLADVFLGSNITVFVNGEKFV